MAEKKRYLFAYEVESTKKKGEFSVVDTSLESARKQIQERVADLEFTDEEDVVIGELIKEMDAEKQLYQCEGCES